MGRPGTVSRIDYGQFLFSSQVNYTQTYFGDHHTAISHDSVNRWMRGYRFSSGDLWEHAKSSVIPSTEGYLVYDDTVLDKRSSHKMDLVRLQYSGNVGGLVKGIGLVNCVYVNPVLGKYWVIDYRIFAPEFDGKTKLDHMREMFDNALLRKRLPFHGVLMDTWYATSSMMEHIHKRGKVFYCPVKANRNICTEDSDSYVHAKDITWIEETKAKGHKCQLKGVDKAITMKAFQVVRSTTQNETIVTNDVASLSTDVVQEVVSHRWKVEQFHRELKQTTGVQNCQCRNHRAIRTHIAMSMLVWLKFTDIARAKESNIYQLKQGLLDQYIIQQLKSPVHRFT